jgi:hypothetical protein
MTIDWETDTTWKRTFDPKTKTDTAVVCKTTKEDSDDELDTKHGLGSGQGKCLINLNGLSGLDD